MPLTAACGFPVIETGNGVAGGVGRLRHETTGEPCPVERPVLPVEVAPLLEPFAVHRALTTRAGWREYVGVREVDG